MCVCVCVPELLCVVLLYFQPLLDKLCIALKEVDPPLSVFVQTVKLVLKMKTGGSGGGEEIHINSSDGGKHHSLIIRRCVIPPTLKVKLRILVNTTGKRGIR